MGYNMEMEGQKTHVEFLSGIDFFHYHVLFPIFKEIIQCDEMKVFLRDYT